MGWLRVRQDWATSLSLFTFMLWRRKWPPTPVFLPGESQGWGSLVGCRLWGRRESDTTEATWQQQQQIVVIKGSACNAGWSWLIAESGRSAGEGIGCLLQYPLASIVTQLVKNPCAILETWDWSLIWEDPLEKGRLPTPVFWPGEFHGLYSPWGRKVSDMIERLSLHCTPYN